MFARNADADYNAQHSSQLFHSKTQACVDPNQLEEADAYARIDYV
jgi:hypothetical protein